MDITLLMQSGKKYIARIDEGSLPSNFTFVRVLHELELPPNRRTTPWNRPEVRPMFPNQYVPFGKNWQLLSWELNDRRYFNAGNMTAIYHTHLWIANRQGFGIEGDPRANYFTNTYLDKRNIRVENLTCGGNILKVIGEGLFKTSGTSPVPCYIVETLSYRTIPSLQELKLKPWLVTTAVQLRGGEDVIPEKFPQGQLPNGDNPGVKHPLVSNPLEAVNVIEKWRVVPWEENTVPDPYRVYLPY